MGIISCLWKNLVSQSKPPEVQGTSPGNVIAGQLNQQQPLITGGPFSGVSSQALATSPEGLPFLIHAMVSAGPRHGPQHRELGEDCAGSVTVGHMSVFWICDGTSDGTQLPALGEQAGFSCRILAQDVGRAFAVELLKSWERTRLRPPADVDIRAMVFDPLAHKWEERLQRYVQELGNAGRLERLLHDLPKSADGSYQMEWSTTFLGGIFDEAQRSLDLVNFGDCCAVIAGNPRKAVERNTWRVFFRATLIRGEPVRVLVFAESNEQTAWQHYTDVVGFLAMTDGLIKATRSAMPQLLRNVQSSIEHRSLDNVFGQLARRFEDTEDDRAVVLGLFLER